MGEKYPSEPRLFTIEKTSYTNLFKISLNIIRYASVGYDFYTLMRVFHKAYNIPTFAP